MACSVDRNRKPGSYVVKQTSWEALYPGEFSDLYPNTQTPPVELKVWDKSVSLPILYLSHVTHKYQAIKIEEESSFIFKTNQKLGKQLGKYDGSPVGKSFKKVDSDEYEEITCSFQVFPGYLSWWGISCRDCYETDFAGRKFKEAVDRVKLSNFYVYEADYLKHPPCSKYGSREFIFSLADLIESYKKSRKDCTNKDVYLRKAGTLRYRYEICYVVMVVMFEDMNDSFIQVMPSMFGEPCFEHNGCIDQEGKLLNDHPPHFKVKHPFTKFKNESHSWESLVFAFYFSKPDQVLRCSKKSGKEEEVKHNPKFCISKQPSSYEEFAPFVCPDYPDYDS